MENRLSTWAKRLGAGGRMLSRARTILEPETWEESCGIGAFKARAATIHTIRSVEITETTAPTPASALPRWNRASFDASRDPTALPKADVSEARPKRISSEAKVRRRPGERSLAP